MRFRSFLDRNHHSEFSNKFVPPFGVAHTYIAYIEEYPSPHRVGGGGGGGKYFTHEKSHYPIPQISMTVMSDLHKVDEYNTDSEDNSLEIEDHDIATPTGTISASGRPVRARF